MCLIRSDGFLNSLLQYKQMNHFVSPTFLCFTTYLLSVPSALFSASLTNVSFGSAFNTSIFVFPAATIFSLLGFGNCSAISLRALTVSLISVNSSMCFMSPCALVMWAFREAIFLKMQVHCVHLYILSMFGGAVCVFSTWTRKFPAADCYYK